MTGQKQLYRSRDSRIIAGVFGGLGKYFNIDATVLRLVWLLITVFTGFIPGLVAYVLAAMIIPLEPK
ncbi:MAG: PspC domain-containing protein [Armatimonadetes bacterium]|nr:MAG: PspC domain-containing protein [Armatimonadota bacterium]